MARAGAARCAGSYLIEAIRRAGFSGAADPSSVALGFAAQAADRFGRADCAAEAMRRGVDPAWPRPHSFDHVVRWAAWRHSRRWRAVGIGNRAPALSRRGLQSVFDRA